MILGRFHHQQGIALGPLLFIIAILALLAAAIAAGSGGFRANTNTESAKAMAEVIVTYADAVGQGLRKVRMDNSCDDLSITKTQISFANPMDATYATARQRISLVYTFWVAAIHFLPQYIELCAKVVYGRV